MWGVHALLPQSKSRSLLFHRHFTWATYLVFPRCRPDCLLGDPGLNWAVSPHFPSQGSHHKPNTWCKPNRFVLNENRSHYDAPFPFLHLIPQEKLQLSIIWEIGAIREAWGTLSLHAAHSNDVNWESHRKNYYYYLKSYWLSLLCPPQRSLQLFDCLAVWLYTDLLHLHE